MSLYDLASEYKALMHLNDPDLPEQVIMDTLEGLQGEIDDKAVNLCKVRRNIEGEIDQIKAEIDRLQRMRKVRENAIDRLRAYLKTNMQACEIWKIDHPLFSITRTKPRPMVRIVDEALIPDEYVEVRTEIKPDKARILKALKEGRDIPGCVLDETEEGLMIR